MARILLSPPDVSGLERDMLLAAFDSGWIAPAGPDLDAFERELAAYLGVEEAAAVASGTAALHLALLLAGVQPGDAVLVPTLTFAATANAVRYVGAEPVFVDCEPEGWVMDPELVAAEARALAREGRRVSAILTVDLYGVVCDHERLQPIAEELGATLVEDAAEALGSTRGGRPAGTCAPLGAFSFNGNKVITTSGGGLLVAPGRPDLVRRARYLSTQAREPVAHYEHLEVGFNYRLSNLLAALGRAQLQGLDARVARRRAIHARYRDALSGRPGVAFQEEPAGSRSNRWLTCITIDPARAGVDREALRLALDAADIEARPVWKPMHLQPVFASARRRGGEVSARLFERGLCLPSGSGLSEPDQGRVLDALDRALRA